MTDPAPEGDPRFPSGPWTGYFLDERVPGKHSMDLRLDFAAGAMTGAGRDFVGQFTVSGRYELSNGECHFHKRYTGKHDVFYRGFNEGKGIWGVWELIESGFQDRGGFHIWPEGMADPSGDQLREEADTPAGADELALV